MNNVVTAKWYCLYDLFGQDNRCFGQHLLVGDGLTEGGPVGRLVDAFAQKGTLGKCEGVTLHPVLAAETGSGVGHAIDKGEVEVLVLATTANSSS